MTDITNGPAAALADMPGVTVVEIGPDGIMGGSGLSALFGRTEVPTNEDGTKNYAALPHMDLDQVPEGGDAEGWASYLQILAALPEVLIVDALFPMVQDLVLAHGVDPADATEAIKDFGRRARERYPDAKLPPDLQEAADAAVAQFEAEQASTTTDDGIGGTGQTDE